MAAIANALQPDRLRGYLEPTLQPLLEPLMALEEFSAGRERAEASLPVLE